MICEFLLAVLGVDLIGPCFKGLTSSHERLPQPPSVWYANGFFVPHVFLAGSKQEAGRSSEDEQQSFVDFAGEEPSNDASHRLEKQVKENDANVVLDQANTHRSWFTSSLGVSFISEMGALQQATVMWRDYRLPSAGYEEKTWLQAPQRQTISFPIKGLDSSHDIPLESNQQGLFLRWIAHSVPRKLRYPADHLSVSLFLLNKLNPPQINQIRYRDPATAHQFAENQTIGSLTRKGRIRSELNHQARKGHQRHQHSTTRIAQHIQTDLQL